MRYVINLVLLVFLFFAGCKDVSTTSQRSGKVADTAVPSIYKTKRFYKAYQKHIADGKTLPADWMEYFEYNYYMADEMDYLFDDNYKFYILYTKGVLRYGEGTQLHLSIKLKDDIGIVTVKEVNNDGEYSVSSFSRRVDDLDSLRAFDTVLRTCVKDIHESQDMYAHFITHVYYYDGKEYHTFSPFDYDYLNKLDSLFLLSPMFNRKEKELIKKYRIILY